jgi:hypothetical protein
MALAVSAMTGHVRIADAAGAGAQLARGIEAVELGHVAVHEHDVEVTGGQRLERLAAVRHHGGHVPELPEHGLDDHLVHAVVLGHQHRQRLDA